MQPMKWRMTYRYRVREIHPNIPLKTERKAAIDPNVPVVGKGTWEVWMDAPKEGEELRDLKLISCSLNPTKETVNDEGMTLYYFDLAPDGYLPREAQFSITWEFTTFERYAFWEGMEFQDYDKTDDFYRRYTSTTGEFAISKAMRKEITKLIPAEHNDQFHVALNCYNYMLENFDYDFSQDWLIPYTGLQKTTDAYRAWQNKTGQCDEFANVLCAMLRTAGIPARPVAGMSHQPTSLIEIGNMAGMSNADAAAEHNMTLEAGAHAWVEFYVPSYGWIPADPTWGQAGTELMVDNQLSRLGCLRGISFADYYFGKSDPYRIPWQKFWDIRLEPAPKTPGATKSELWFIGATERRSGVKDFTYGWEGIPGAGGG